MTLDFPTNIRRLSWHFGLLEKGAYKLLQLDHMLLFYCTHRLLYHSTSGVNLLYLTCPIMLERKKRRRLCDATDVPLPLQAILLVRVKHRAALAADENKISGIALS